MIVVGIDGGGTRSRAVVEDGHGRVLARAAGGPGLLDPGAVEAGAERLVALSRDVLLEAGGASTADVLCCAAAGAGAPVVRAAVTQVLARAGVADRVLLVTDLEAAFQAAFGARDAGILVVAGTGSSAWGRAADGRTARAGGWGAVVGDEGSGWWLGRAAVRAVLRAHDGRGRPTRLSAAVRDTAAGAAPEALPAWVAGAGKATVAGLAPAVLAAAAAGDGVAATLVRTAADDLAELVAALVRGLGPWPEPPPVAAVGGLFTGAPSLTAAFDAALARGGARAVRRTLNAVQRDAARGAAALARAAGADT
ncbi:MAG: BadF/BadG/BcrA/BcrD ATPase family protein [Gemmatimonadota bacterium]